MIVFCWCTHWSDSSRTPPGCCSRSPHRGTPGWLATTCCLQIDNRRPFLCLHGTKSQCISILYTFPLKNTSCSSKHCLKIFSYLFPCLGGPKTLTRVTLNLGCFLAHQYNQLILTPCCTTVWRSDESGLNHYLWLWWVWIWIYMNLQQINVNYNYINETITTLMILQYVDTFCPHLLSPISQYNLV